MKAPPRLQALIDEGLIDEGLIDEGLIDGGQRQLMSGKEAMCRRQQSWWPTPRAKPRRA